MQQPSASRSNAQKIRDWAKRLKRNALMLWFACRHPDTPVTVKAWCFFTVAYALSPIDLIPDFIPVLGYLDEVILLPAMIWLALRWLPQDVREVCGAQAEQWMAESKSRPRSYLGAGLIVAVWIAIAVGCWQLLRA